MKSELDITKAICVYLRRNGYLLYCDIAAGLHLSPYQAMLVSQLRCGRGLPDILLFHRFGDYVGLALEVKRSESEFRTKSGQFRSSEHIREQLEVMSKLTEQGWYCEFVTSVQQVESIINKLKSKT